MAFYNFGYAGSMAHAAITAMHARDIGPIQPSGINTESHNMGDIGRSQIAQLTVMGGNFDFIWGSHLWGSKKYKVAK